MFDSTDNFLTPPHISLYLHLSDVLNDNFNWRRLSFFRFNSVSNFTLSHHCNSYKSYTSAPLTMLQYDLESSFIIITPPVFTPLMITFKQFVLPSRAASAAIETHFRSGTIYFIIIVVIWTV